MVDRLAEVDALRDEYSGYIRAARERRVDVSIGYPKEVVQYGPMKQLFIEGWRWAVDNLNSGDKPEQARRIVEFFGGSESSIVLPSAGEAIASSILHLTPSGTEVAVLSPAWPIYEEYARTAGETPRGFLRESSLPRLKYAIERDDRPVSMIIVNDPRNPDMHEYSREDLETIRELADARGLVVLYDEAFWPWTNDGVVQRVGDTNKVLRDYPRAELSVSIRDTSKLFPAPPFSKACVVSMSEALGREKRGAKMIGAESAQHYSDPVASDLYALSVVLHSPDLSSLIDDLKLLTNENVELLRERGGEKTKIEHCGPFALVSGGFGGDTRMADYFLKSFSIVGLTSQDYGTHGEFIRIPLVTGREEFEGMLDNFFANIDLIKVGVAPFSRLQAMRAGAA